eukprot:scpid72182/ scgid12452/ 
MQRAHCKRFSPTKMCQVYLSYKVFMPMGLISSKTTHGHAHPASRVAPSTSTSPMPVSLVPHAIPVNSTKLQAGDTSSVAGLATIHGPSSTRQIFPRFTKERNTLAFSTSATMERLTTFSHFEPSEEDPSALGRRAIIGISASAGTVLVLCVICSVVWKYRMTTRRCGSNEDSDKKHQYSNKMAEETGIYETVIGERLDQIAVPMTVQTPTEAAVPMYESTAYMSTTKKSCQLTSNDAYGATSDMF